MTPETLPGDTRSSDPTTRPLRVSWNGGEDPSQIFEAAHVPADRWNGWAKPYFSQDECERLAATQAEFDDSLKFEYDPARRVWQEFNVEEDYRQDCPTMTVAGKVCHQIGSGFTWLELPGEPRQTVRENSTPNSPVKVRARALPRSKPSSSGPLGDHSPVAVPGAVDAAFGPEL